jgi:hypothetical protein
MVCVQLHEETMRANRANTRDIVNENLWIIPDQRSVEDLLFESFGRTIMAKGLYKMHFVQLRLTKNMEISSSREKKNNKKTLNMVLPLVF